MARTKSDVTPAELDILHVLWRDGPVSVRHIADKLYPGGGTSHYASAQKLLERLETKKIVQRDRNGPVQLFFSPGGKEEILSRRLRSMAEQLCEGSLTPILTHLAENVSLSAQERKSLRELIDSSPKEKRRIPR
ncbi:MAG: BlaI/MecI/CopY family transcriptional regulator [Gemmataceae bacterium]|nr:BlaI/MecI/CopY family transcriptional regulator [Gemmataceae bacterium]